MITKDKIDICSIDDWETEFSEIYGNIDAERRPADIWSLLIEDASRFAECIREERYNDSLVVLAHITCWIFSFVRRCRIENNLQIRIQESLSQIVWEKYPGRCPRCSGDWCICSAQQWKLKRLSEKERQKELEEIKKVLINARRHTELIPKSLDGFTAMFDTIYGGAHSPLPIETIAFHFMEEVGEVCSCIRGLREDMRKPIDKDGEKLKKDLRDEIADTISWVMSLLTKLDYILGAGAAYIHGAQSLSPKEKNPSQTVGLRLSHVIWEAFQVPGKDLLHCPECGKRPCECIPTAL